MGWIRRRIEGIGDNLVAATLGAVALAIAPTVWNVFRGVDPVLSLLGFLAIVAIVLVVWNEFGYGIKRRGRRGQDADILSLLREVGIHMLMNRPVTQDPLGRLGENVKWWVDRTVQELTLANAAQRDISRFRDLGTLTTVVLGEDGPHGPHTHARSVAATHLERLEEAMRRLR